MNVIGYLRVSTQEQSGSGHGLAAQETALRDACERREWVLLDVVRDEGQSGKNLARTGLQSVLGRIAVGEADGLIVAKLDRLTRSMLDFALLLEWFAASSATLVALDMDFDTSTPVGEAMANILATFAQFERRLISQRTKDGLAEAKRKHPRAFRASVADDPEVLQLIHDLRDCGLSAGQICRELEDRGIPTPRGGLVWRQSALQTALGYRRPVKARRAIQLPEIVRTR